MPKIDPRDVLPQSNLPVPSIPWGRAIESRLRGVEERVLIDKQDIDGQNRTTAAQLAAISEQLAAIRNTQTELVSQQQALSAQQTQLSNQQTRLAETNQVYTRVIGVSTNASGFFPLITLAKPTWANAAFVTGSMIPDSGSTTREALLVTTLGNNDHTGPQISNYSVAGSTIFLFELSQMMVATDFPGGNLQVGTYRNSVASGTGTLAVRQFINVTWVYDSNISLAEESTSDPEPTLEQE